MSSTGKVSVGMPTRLRSFDPVRLADLEYGAWVGYYLRRWPRVLIALVRLVRMGFGMDWRRTLHGAWLMLRAAQLWAPNPDNDPKGALACMRRSTPWSSSPMASLPTRPRPPNSRSTGGVCIARVSTGTAHARSMTRSPLRNWWSR